MEKTPHRLSLCCLLLWVSVALISVETASAGDGNSTEPFTECRLSRTTFWVRNRCASDAGCNAPTTNLRCIGCKCVCRPGLYFSWTTFCCHRTCDDFGTFNTEYLGATFTSPSLLVANKTYDDTYGFGSVHCEYTDCKEDPLCQAFSYTRQNNTLYCNTFSVLPSNATGTLLLDTGVDGGVYLRDCK